MSVIKRDDVTGITRGKVLDLAKQVINGERQDQYGSPEDSFSHIADYWSVYLSERESTHIVLSANDICAMMTLFKIAREANQHKADNLVDAAGYIGIWGDL
jgi:hypothetical protein